MKYLTLLFIFINILIVSGQVDYTKYYFSTQYQDLHRNNQGNFNSEDDATLTGIHIIWPAKNGFQIVKLEEPEDYNFESGGQISYQEFFLHSFAPDVASVGVFDDSFNIYWQYYGRESTGEDIYFSKNSDAMIVFDYAYRTIEIWHNKNEKTGKYDDIRRLNNIEFINKSELSRKEKEYIPQTLRK
tara:strand:- start:1253 stop:1810 length:558 start_codon:yes stop_codon:yes gene_type:complete